MTRTRLTYVAFLAVLLSPMAANAGLIGFNFSQGGFDEGADVTGIFYGQDLDGNGQLSSFAGEITYFSMSFSGNSIVGAFSLGFLDLFGLVYDLDGGDLGDGISLDVEGIGAFGGRYEYAAGPGPFGICGIGLDCAYVFDFDTGAETLSQELVLISRIPEPGTLALLGIGLLGMGLSRRRKV